MPYIRASSDCSDYWSRVFRILPLNLSDASLLLRTACNTILSMEILVKLMASSFSELYNLRKLCRGSIWDCVDTSIKDWMMDYLINSNRGRQSEKSCTAIDQMLLEYRCFVISSMGTKRYHHKWGAWVQLALEWRTCAPKVTPPVCCTTTRIQVWTCCPQVPYRIGRIVQDWCWLGWRRFLPF